jgi:hypothetical protein
VGFPAALGHAVRAEKNLCNVAVARLLDPAIEGAQRQDCGSAWNKDPD